MHLGLTTNNFFYFFKLFFDFLSLNLAVIIINCLIIILIYLLRFLIIKFFKSVRFSWKYCRLKLHHNIFFNSFFILQSWWLNSKNVFSLRNHPLCWWLVFLSETSLYPSHFSFIAINSLLHGWFQIIIVF